MSRIAKSPITVPEGVDISQSEGTLSVKGKLGEMTMHVNSSVVITNTDNVLTFSTSEVSKKEEKGAWAQAGTVRANTANLIKGVTEGWEKKLTLIGDKTVDTLDICCICLTNICNVITDCNHQYCSKCLEQWIFKTINQFCPYCKKAEMILYNLSKH